MRLCRGAAVGLSACDADADEAILHLIGIAARIASAWDRSQWGGGRRGAGTGRGAESGGQARLACRASLGSVCARADASGLGDAPGDGAGLWRLLLFVEGLVEHGEQH